MTWFEHDLSRALAIRTGHRPEKVIEQIPIGVAVTLPRGAIEYANLNLRQWLGLSVERY